MKSIFVFRCRLTERTRLFYYRLACLAVLYKLIDPFSILREREKIGSVFWSETERLSIESHTCNREKRGQPWIAFVNEFIAQSVVIETNECKPARRPLDDNENAYTYLTVRRYEVPFKLDICLFASAGII